MASSSSAQHSKSPDFSRLLVLRAGPLLMPDNSDRKSFYFGNDHQNALIACWAAHPSEFEDIGARILPEYLWGVTATIVVKTMHEYYAQYQRWPSLTVIDSRLQEKYSRAAADQYKEQHKFIQEKLAVVDTADWQYYLDTAAQFCRERAFIVAIKRAADSVSGGEMDKDAPKIRAEIEAALEIGTPAADYPVLTPEDILMTPIDEGQTLLGRHQAQYSRSI
jgi:hypothetical protein